MVADTNWSITNISLPQGSNRNIQFTLTQEDFGERYRTVNQVVRNAVNPSWGEKYILNVNGNDINAPTLDNVSIGDSVTVNAGNSLNARIPAGQTAVTLQRVPVSGSDSAEDTDGTSVSVTVSEATAGVWEATIASQAKDVIVSYRPQLTMMIDALTVHDFREWAASVNWAMTLIEV